MRAPRIGEALKMPLGSRYTVNALLARGVACAAAAVVLCVPAQAWAFRSASDLADFSGSPSVRFSSPLVDVQLFGELPQDLDPAQVDTALTQAAATWSAQACTNLVLSYDGQTNVPAQPGDGLNTIQWVSDWAKRGFPAAAPGLTDVQYVKEAGGRWRIAEADTYLNAGFNWTTGAPLGDRKSLVAVMTHELGHLLGLLHVCEVNGSDGAPPCASSHAYLAEEMYPIYSPEQTHLSDDDSAGVCALYPVACDVSSCPDGQVCGAAGCTSLCGSEICAAGSFCNGGKCVPQPKDCGLNGCLGQACTIDQDCAQREFCNDHVCTQGNGALGDPCSKAQQCADGACSNGACARSCSAADQCESGSSCDATNGACSTALSALGKSCAYATDCTGGYCLAETEHAPVCSRSCAAGGAQCPADWSCRTVDESRVCTPLTLTADGGCSVTATTSPPISPSALIVGALSMISWRRVRRRQSRRSKQ